MQQEPGLTENYVSRQANGSVVWHFFVAEEKPGLQEVSAVIDRIPPEAHYRCSRDQSRNGSGCLRQTC